jgi:hypothetical protein
MPGGSRSLPGRPSLRHLKLEAKRRLAAGEFATLHDAQVAIAREHGLPTWAALKQRVGDTPDSHALDQLRWIIARFADADQPGWIAHEALTPQSGPGPGGGGVGLGWLITPHPRSSDARRPDQPHDPGQLHRDAPAPGVDQP